MPVGQGHASYIGFATQSTLGTPVTRTKFLDIISESLIGQRTREHSPSLGSPSQRVHVEMASQSGGSIELEGSFEGLDTLLYHAMGAKASAQLGATAAYTHTLTLAASLPSPGLSIEVERDIQAFLYEGCKINTLNFEQSGDYLRVSLDILGRGETKVSATSPTFPTSTPIHKSQFAFTIDAGAVTCNNFSLSINNALEQRTQLGSVLPKEIIRTGVRSVTGGFEIDFEDTTEYDNWVSNADVALVATWTGAEIESPNNYELKLTMPRVHYEGQPPAVGGRGPITVPFTFVALEQTRNAQDELTTELTNTATTIT